MDNFRANKKDWGLSGGLSGCFRTFEEKTVPQTGQVPTMVPLEKGGKAEFCNDESTLLYILMAYFAKSNGINIDPEKLKQAAQFVTSHVNEKGFYISSSESFCTWADTVKNPQKRECFAYNQGLYALAANVLAKMGMGNIEGKAAAIAVENYRSFYHPQNGCLSMGNEIYNNAQDISSLLPEFLSRYLLGKPMLPDEYVLKTVDHLLSTAAVRFDDGKLAGIKVISSLNGQFLPPEEFEEPKRLNPPGYYQNGGYWPMFTLVTLSLAYKIKPEQRYEKVVEELLQSETAYGLCSKEYLVMAKGEQLGKALPDRFNYSWNVLAYQALAWSGLLSPSTPGVI